MNHDEVMALSDQELVDAVLQIQGYTFSGEGIANRHYNDKYGCHYIDQDLPDYLHSLDDCFELMQEIDCIWSVEYGYSETAKYSCKMVGRRFIYTDGDTLNIAILRAYLLSRGEK